MLNLGALRLGGRSHRVPLILQTEAAECGLACLAMVASAHGYRTDLPTLRRRFSLSAKGVALGDLVRMADALQLHSRALRAELDDLSQLQTPCILHWDLNHFVVLVSIRRGVALIHDPAHGLAPAPARRTLAPLHRRRARTAAGAWFRAQGRNAACQPAPAARPR